MLKFFVGGDIHIFDVVCVYDVYQFDNTDGKLIISGDLVFPKISDKKGDVEVFDGLPERAITAWVTVLGEVISCDSFELVEKDLSVTIVKIKLANCEGKNALEGVVLGAFASLFKTVEKKDLSTIRMKVNFINVHKVFDIMCQQNVYVKSEDKDLKMGVLKLSNGMLILSDNLCFKVVHCGVMTICNTEVFEFCAVNSLCLARHNSKTTLLSKFNENACRMIDGCPDLERKCPAAAKAGYSSFKLVPVLGTTDVNGCFPLVFIWTAVDNSFGSVFQGFFLETTYGLRVGNTGCMMQCIVVALRVFDEDVIDQVYCNSNSMASILPVISPEPVKVLEYASNSPYVLNFVYKMEKCELQIGIGAVGHCCKVLLCTATIGKEMQRESGSRMSTLMK